MQTTLTKWAIATFVSLGGITMVVKWILSGEEKALDRAMDKILSNHKYRPLFIKWRPQIEEALRVLDTVVDQKLDEAAKEDASKNIPKT